MAREGRQGMKIHVGQGFGPAAGLMPGAEAYISPAPRGSATAAQKGWPHMDSRQSGQWQIVVTVG